MITSRGIIGILAGIFILPVVAAMAFYWSGWFLEMKRTNHGEFMQAKPIAGLVMPNSTHWRLVYAPLQPCEQGCLKEMETLARMRLALGRQLYGLELWLLLPSGQALTTVQQAIFKDMAVNVMLQPKAYHQQYAAQILLLNARNEGVLSYDSIRKVGDVFADLKQLIALWHA